MRNRRFVLIACLPVIAVSGAAMLGITNRAARHAMSALARRSVSALRPRVGERAAAPSGGSFDGALRELLQRSAGLQSSERHGLQTFYRSRAFSPLWTESNGWNARAGALIGFLSTVDAEGLDPGDYTVPDIHDVTAGAVAAAELRLTSAVLTYARDVQNGRIRIPPLASEIDYAPKVIDPVDLLMKLAKASDARGVIADLGPPHEGYRRLKARLAEMRAARRGGSADPLEAIVLANMERWRWLPRDLGESYVIVNIPDYTLALIRNGSVVFRARIVVGEPARPTPITSTAMNSITINPQWNVPRSIAEREYLPLLAKEPKALERIGLALDRRADGSIHLYQPPGENNALGRIRFNISNRFLVFQHDTPDKLVFDQPKRASSHGCMRVDEPLKYAEALLALALPQQRYTESALRHLFGPAEVEIEFATPIPVHLTYQTAFVDDSARLAIRDDIYGLDARMARQLGAARLRGHGLTNAGGRLRQACSL
jgi:L,D-transpeptidase YcbB